jgi:hypothetical protein
VRPLESIQHEFQRFLLGEDSLIEGDVVATQKVPAQARLAIYGDGYRARLIEALEHSYPVLAAVLDEQFEALAAKYVSAHESTFFSIRYYGDGLAEFLRTDADYSSMPVLAELARWEWALAAVFDAADAQPIEIAFFASLAPEQWSELRFEWHPAVHVVELSWNAAELWQAVTEEAERPDPEPYPRATSWLLWRRELQIYLRRLGEEEVAVIEVARAGRSFGELCEVLCDHLEEHAASMHAAGFLRGWVEAGLLVSARLPPADPSEPDTPPQML